MRVVAIDTETETFSSARMAPPLVCVSVAQATDDVDEEFVKAFGVCAALGRGTGLDSYLTVGLIHARDNAQRPRVSELWRAAARGEVTLVGHHMAYDACVLMADEPELIPVIFEAYARGSVSDTMIRQKLFDIAAGCYRGYSRVKGNDTIWIKYTYDLEALAMRHLGVQLDKNNPWRMRYGQLLDKPIADWPSGAISYAEDDGGATLGAWLVQRGHEILAPGILDDEARQVRAALALQLASVWGIRTDADGVAALKRDATAEIDRLRELLVREGLLRRNGTRRMKAAFERMKQINPNGKKTKTGRPSLDEEACNDSGDAVLIALSQYGQAQNTLSKDVRALVRGIVLPIHTRFDSLMDTGRTSSSGEYNLQNPRRKKGVRECFVPRPGRVFAACDFDKAELCTLAQVCITVFGHSALGDALNAGIDPHLKLGAQVIGVSYEDALQYKADPEMKEARQNAKPINFGIPGGMGADGLRAYAKQAYGVDFSEQEVKSWIGAYHEMCPEMREYFAWIRAMCGEARIASIVQLFSNRRRGLIPYTVACNSFFQGLAADGAKAAMWEVCRRQYADPSSPLFGTRTVNFVHDELILEVPEDNAHEAAMELQRVMIAAFNPWVPDVPVKASVTLMRRWSKAAEPTWDGDRLIPWDDAQEAA